MNKTPQDKTCIDWDVSIINEVSTDASLSYWKDRGTPQNMNNQKWYIRQQQASYKSLWRLNLCRIQPDGDLYPCNRGTPKITPKLTYNSVKWYVKYAGVVFASVALPVLLLLAKYFEETFYTPGVLIWQFILIQRKKDHVTSEENRSGSFWKR